MDKGLALQEVDILAMYFGRPDWESAPDLTEERQLMEHELGVEWRQVLLRKHKQYIRDRERAKRVRDNPRKKSRLTPFERAEIVRAYSTDLIPTQELAEQYRVTRVTIYKTLKKAGIVPADMGKMAVSCSVCGTQIIRHRNKVRKQLHHFCSNECYHAFLLAGNGNPLVMNRHSSRIAREIVSQYFALAPQHIVHHEDRNQFNNILENLKVFANQGDHVRHHRGFDVVPLWNGADL